MNPIPFQTAQQARTPQPGPGARPAVLPANDTRWLLAARVSLAASASAQTSPRDRERLTAWAVSKGLSPIHASAIVSITERAVARGGLDAAAADEIAALPTPEPAKTPDRVGPVLTGVIVTLAVIAGLLLIARLT